MGQIKNIRGQRFHRLVVVDLLKVHNHKALWKCQCDCGNTTTALSGNLKSGNTKSCGCLKEETSALSFPIHGHRTKEHTSITYNSWRGMNKRCYDINNDSYSYYGGRGIIVCERWKDSFENFLEDMGQRPEGTSIDREDPNGNYEVSNCRWATHSEQMLNRRPFEVS